METYDLVVIGAGPGGYPAAIRAAQLGASVLIVEKEKLGGTCLNWGCIPTKSLLFSSETFRNISHSAHLGVKASDVKFDYSVMLERKNRIVEKLGGGIEQLLKANGVEIIKGAASFVERNKISIKSKEGAEKAKLVKAAASIIATGSTSAMPKQLPKSSAIIESRAFLDLEKLPKSMIIMGGGVVGCEFACMTAQLGVKVTIVEIMPDILPMLDPDVRAPVRKHMEQDLGINILTGAALEQIKAKAGSVEGTVNGKKISADLLLVAVGRRPSTEELSLESAGVKLNANGCVISNEHCRTSAASIYAIGDVAGGPQLAHYATAQGVMVAELISGIRRKPLGVVPACIFTSPEVGSAGLTEQDAKTQNKSVRVGKFAFAASGKAMAADQTEGFVKWIADAETDRLLGAQAVGPHATELISEAVVAIQFELTASELGQTIHCHPTLSEAWMEAAHAVHSQCIHAAPKKRAK